MPSCWKGFVSRETDDLRVRLFFFRSLCFCCFFTKKPSSSASMALVAPSAAKLLSENMSSSDNAFRTGFAKSTALWHSNRLGDGYSRDQKYSERVYNKDEASEVVNDRASEGKLSMMLWTTAVARSSGSAVVSPKISICSLFSANQRTREDKLKKMGPFHKGAHSPLYTSC